MILPKVSVPSRTTEFCTVRQANPMMVALATAVLSACAAGAPKESPAPIGPTAIERVVATDIEATWSTLIAGINGREFEINSLAEQDRTIQVLVQSATPSRYVDCGEITVRSKHPAFGERNYNFPAANSARGGQA